MECLLASGSSGSGYLLPNTRTRQSSRIKKNRYNGYSYLQRGLGTPLITPSPAAKDGLASVPTNFFINNRLWAVHAGFLGTVLGWDVKALTTLSRNSGTYATSGEPYRSPFGIITIPNKENKFKTVNQLSTHFSATKHLQKRAYLGIDLAGDVGGLYDSSFGLAVRYGVKL